MTTTMPRLDFSIRMFVPTHQFDRTPRLIGTFSQEQATAIVKEISEDLVAQHITEVRWPDYLAKEILTASQDKDLDGDVSHLILALAVIDGHPLGRNRIEDVRYIEARIDHGGALIVAAADDNEERQEARRQLFADQQQQMAA